jgi:hypothetical protein
MENLLKNDFTAHYGLPVSTVTNISMQTNEPYFEIEDDADREILLHFTVGSGMAKYKNPHQYEMTIINYDKFITALPYSFHEGKKRCDVIVYTNTSQEYFLLSELKDRQPDTKVRKKAKSQLLASITLLMAVSSIKSFAHTFAVKRCCFFNKQPIAPPLLTATTAFGRIGTISRNGLQMPNPDIEAFGFEYYEYLGSHVCSL